MVDSMSDIEGRFGLPSISNGDNRPNDGLSELKMLGKVESASPKLGLVVGSVGLTLCFDFAPDRFVMGIACVDLHNSLVACCGF